MRVPLMAAMLASLVGCPSDPPPECLADPVDTTCAPLYEPTFANVYDRTLKKGCGSDRAACHSARGRAGGMSFEDPDTAYAALVVDNDHVKPGDPTCSELIVRVASPGTDYQMPPGDALSSAEVCALIQWVQAGAPR